MKEVFEMFENKETTNEKTHTEFIEIYEDEIKRLLQRNEELEKRNNSMEVENKQLKLKLQELLRELETRDKSYQEKMKFEISEKTKLLNLVNQYKKNQQTSDSSEELTIRLNVEKEKVQSLKEVLESKENQIDQLEQSRKKENRSEQESRNLEQKLIAEKKELAEILIDARIQAKDIVKRADIEVDRKKEQAQQDIKTATEKANLINNQLEQVKNSTTIFISGLMDQVNQIFE